MKLLKQECLYLRTQEVDQLYTINLYIVDNDKNSEVNAANQDQAKRYFIKTELFNHGICLDEDSPAILLNQAMAEQQFAHLVQAKLKQGYRQYADIDFDNSQFELIPKSLPLKQYENIEAIILSRLNDKIKENAFDKKLKRLVWRIGELRLIKAVPTLQQCLGKADNLLDYCLLWSIGRCATTDSFTLIEKFHQQANTDYVKRIAFEVLLALADYNKRQQLLVSVYQSLPKKVEDSLRQGDYKALLMQVADSITANQPETVALLYNLYLIARVDASVHNVLLSVLVDIPLTPNRFKAVRYIYKAAEFRDDTKVFGLLTSVIDRHKPFAFKCSFSNQVTLPGTWKSVLMSDEAPKYKSRLAFTNNTRNYFRRRSLRRLRRFGDLNDSLYIKYAVGMLLSVRDADGNQGFTAIKYRHVDDGSEWGSYQRFTTEYSEYNRFMVFHYILHQNDPGYSLNYSSGLWYKIINRQATAECRTEAFSHLWDKHPEALLHLLCQAKCRLVHDFACRLFSEHKWYWDLVSVKQLQQMISQPYEATVELALAIVDQRFSSSEEVDIELLVVLINASVLQARQHALSCLTQSPSLLSNSLDLVLNIISSPYEDVQAWAHEQISNLNLSQQDQQNIIIRLLAFLQGLSQSSTRNGTKLDIEATVQSVQWYFLNVFTEKINSIDSAVIADLLAHELIPIKLLACEMIEKSQFAVERLPVELITSLMDHQLAEVKVIGVRLFSNLPSDFLIQHYDLIYSYSTSEHAEIRQACRSLIRRLAQYDQEFGNKLMHELSDSLFRKQPADGVHDDVIQILTVELNQFSRLLDAETIWRLLVARSNAANRFAGILLGTIKPQTFTVRQWARLAANPVYLVRQWVWRAYKEYADVIRENLLDAIRIFDVAWDDSRQFAIEYFRHMFNQYDVEPELIVSICDNARADVQEFACELLDEKLKQGLGIEVLDKLGQHPAVNVQSFLTEYLPKYANANIERIIGLEQYFITVLSHINKSRVAKSRIMQFLREQALQSEQIAQVAARILNRQSVTAVMCDHSDYMLLMRDLQNKYPNLDLPIKRRMLIHNSANPQGSKHVV